MLEDLLLDHILTEFKQIDTVDEILLWEIVAFTLTDALDCLRSKLLVLHDLFEAEELILTKDDKPQYFDIFDRINIDTTAKITMLIATSYLLQHHLASGPSRQARMQVLLGVGCVAREGFLGHLLVTMRPAIVDGLSNLEVALSDEV